MFFNGSRLCLVPYLKTKHNKYKLIFKLKNNMEEKDQSKALNKTDVSSSDFRIVEYKDHFRVQKRTFVDTWFYFLGIALWVNGKKEEWNTILKNKTFLSIRNWSETENYQFKTKEECLEWISDYIKYPVYHYC